MCDQNFSFKGSYGLYLRPVLIENEWHIEIAYWKNGRKIFWRYYGPYPSDTLYAHSIKLHKAMEPSIDLAIEALRAFEQKDGK